MANNTTAFNVVPNNLLLASVVFKFIAMIIGVLGNVTVIIHTIFLSKEKTATFYLVGNLALADLLLCLTFYPIWIIEFIQIIVDIDGDEDLFCKFSRATLWAFMFASIATLLAITVDRYVYIVNPLRYSLIVTHRRVFRAVSGIWITACCMFIVHYIYDRSDDNFPIICYTPIISIYYPSSVVTGYLPLTLIFLLNFRIFSVARKQRKRILAETIITRPDKSTEQSVSRMNFALGFFVALKTAKTFAIVVAVLTICNLIPNLVGLILCESVCTSPQCQYIWYVGFHYELYVINSVVNAFIYGMRHVKHRKAYLHILFKIFSCRKVNN